MVSREGRPLGLSQTCSEPDLSGSPLRSPNGVAVPKSAPTEPPVDLVYTWVDGSDADLLADLDRYAMRDDQRNPERTRDLHDLLRFSLRSVDRFVPWVRRIFLITRRPQIPAWLDLSNPKITVVHHDELEGFSPYLPTFNSTVIESFAHEVPGLADHFIYMNDDFLFGAPNTIRDYLTPDGKHLVYGTRFGVWIPGRIYRERWKIFRAASHLEHCPRLIRKQFFEEMLASKPRAIARTRSSRFRKGTDLRMDRMYRTWMLGPRRAWSSAVLGRDLVRFHRFHRIDNNLEDQRDALDQLARMTPKFYCLNDDQGLHANECVVACVRAFLQAYYPTPSEFEIGADV